MKVFLQYLQSHAVFHRDLNVRERDAIGSDNAKSKMESL